MRRYVVLVAGAALLAAVVIGVGGCGASATSTDTTAKSLLDQLVSAGTAAATAQASDASTEATADTSTASAAETATDAGADPLQLTENQQAQAETICAELRADIDALHQDAWNAIRNLLTDEQKALFDAHQPPPGPPGGGPGPGHMGGEHGGLGGPPPPPPDAGSDADHAQEMLDRLTEDLDLTADQQASVKTILDALETAVQARMESAKTDFRALLTEEQAAAFDALEQEHPVPFCMPGGPGPGGGPEGHLAELLQLTQDQQTQADAIFTETRTDIDTLHTDAWDQIRALLTDAQAAELDALGPPGPPPGGPGGHMGGHGHGPGGLPPPPPPPGAPGTDRAQALLEWLTKELDLTTDQQASIKTILDNLETSVQARMDQAKADFRAILTAEQAAILDEIEAAHSTRL